jgi:seryl-tRNA synthetase
MFKTNLLSGERNQLMADLTRRGMDEHAARDMVYKLRDLDKARKEAINERDQQKALANQLNKEIGLTYRNKEPIKAGILKERGKQIKATVATLDATAKQIEAERLTFALTIPNMLHDDVPAGKTETDNEEVFKTDHDLTTLTADHVDIGNAAGFRLEDAVNIAGTRFAAYEGDIARLERAIGNFFLDTHIDEHGYTEVAVPFIANEDALIGTGQLPKFGDDMFKIDLNGRTAYLIPTAEVPLTNLYRDRTLNEADLPIRVTALTPCFRAEAGTYGKDTRGLIRQHQFYKVELVQITTPELAEQQHQELLGHATKILDLLDLPYRVVLLCAGDTSFAAHKCYDIEVWIPSQNTYREISSVSQFGDFQARRMGTTYRPKGQKKNRYVNTLNGSGLAVGRTLVAIIENYYRDGVIHIPEVLIPYMKGRKTIPVGEIK